MKQRKLLFYIAIVQMCTAATCGSGESNDYLTRLYHDAFKSGNPLIKDPEMVYEPLVGTWMVENDRMLVVTKRDDKCLYFRFLSHTIGGEDITYKAYVNYLGTDRYISLLAYQEKFMYFKIQKDSGENLKMQMVLNDIRGMNPTGTLASYLQNRGVDTLPIWRTVHFTHFTNAGRDAYIANYYGRQVQALETFDQFKNKFPGFGGLDSIKERSIQYTLEHTHSIKKLFDYTTFYPEIKPRVAKAAKSKCYYTTACLEYLSYFPDDPAKDSILNIAFERCGDDAGNMEALLFAYPFDKRCNGFDYKLAYATAAQKRSGRYFSPWDKEAFDNRCARIPSILPFYKSLEKFNKINLNENGFMPCGYALSKTGRQQVDSLVKHIQFLNAKFPNVEDLYFVLNADTSNLSENGHVIFFKIAVNRCIYLQKTLEEKLPGLRIHCIPYVETTYSTAYGHSGQFFTRADEVPDEKRGLSRAKDKLKLRKIKIDEYGALRNTEYLPESELIDMIMEVLPEQINLYLKQQPYARVIPVNYWDESYRSIQPNFDKYKEKIMDKAAEKGFDVKKLQHFVME